jgi:hypothetical protein
MVDRKKAAQLADELDEIGVTMAHQALLPRVQNAIDFLRAFAAQEDAPGDWVLVMRELEEGYRSRCNYCKGNVGHCDNPSFPCRGRDARELLAAQRAQEDAEPVAWITPDVLETLRNGIGLVAQLFAKEVPAHRMGWDGAVPLYAHPPRQPSAQPNNESGTAKNADAEASGIQSVTLNQDAGVAPGPLSPQSKPSAPVSEQDLFAKALRAELDAKAGPTATVTPNAEAWALWAWQARAALSRKGEG